MIAKINIMTLLVEMVGYYESCNDYIQYRNCLTVYIDWLHISGCDEQIQENETREFFGASISDTFNRVSHSSDFIIKKAPIEQAAEEEANNPIYKLVDFGHV